MTRRPPAAPTALTVLVALVAAVAVLTMAAWVPAAAQTPDTLPAETTTTTIDPAVVAAQAAAGLRLPTPRILTSPPADRAHLVNLPTWLWLEPATPARNAATTAGTTVEAAATPATVRFDTGDGASVTCPGQGVPFDPSRPAAAQPGGCTHTWTRSSNTNPGGTFGVTATLTWTVSWAGGTLGTRQTTTTVDLAVAESQGVTRPPVTLPGQTIIGGPGATTGPGTGWNGQPAPDADDDGGGNPFSSAWRSVTHCFAGGDRTCLKVGATIVAATATTLAVIAICGTVIGCVILAAGAAGVVGGGLSGYLFCGDDDKAACTGKGALAGGLAGLAFIGVTLVAGPIAGGAAAGFTNSLLTQLLNGESVDPKQLLIETAAGAALAWLFGRLPTRPRTPTKPPPKTAPPPPRTPPAEPPPKPPALPIEPSNRPPVEPPLKPPNGAEPPVAEPIKPDSQIARVIPDPAARRVTLREGTKDAIQNNAPKTANGDYIDPNTGTVIPKDGPLDYGHKPEYEWWRTQERARAENWTRQQVIEYENDPNHYQIEDPSSNRSRTFEAPREASPSP